MRRLAFHYPSPPLVDVEEMDVPVWGRLRVKVLSLTVLYSQPLQFDYDHSVDVSRSHRSGLVDIVQFLDLTPR